MSATPVVIEMIFVSKQELIIMSVEANKALVREFADLIDAGDLESALTFFSPDYTDHTPSIGLPPGVEGVRVFYNAQFAAFADRRTTSLDMIGEGDKVVHRLSGDITHTGEFLGIPPTGKHVTWSCIDIWRIADGKFVEHWVEADMMGLMQQLGVMPPVNAQ
ncbi:MAG: ester cyclase [Chloroflexi bacterium]|nr:ester cyclase [Chloroflexota bacterium]